MARYDAVRDTLRYHIVRGKAYSGEDTEGSGGSLDRDLPPPRTLKPRGRSDTKNLTNRIKLNEQKTCAKMFFKHKRTQAAEIDSDLQTRPNVLSKLVEVRHPCEFVANPFSGSRDIDRKPRFFVPADLDL